VTFVINPSAVDQVSAIANDGRRYQVAWAAAFQAGTTADPVVRDPEGLVVAQDGEVLDDYSLHGYSVCATGDSIIILSIKSSARPPVEARLGLG
jgi:hypothetical protein